MVDVRPNFEKTVRILGNYDFMENLPTGKAFRGDIGPLLKDHYVALLDN